MKYSIPSNALKIHYNYGTQKGYYHVWKVTECRWQWQAMGNSGEESTQDKAIYSARQWIMDQKIKQ